MKKINIIVLIAFLGILSSCSYDRSPGAAMHDPNDPGFNYEFEGDMYFAVSYDPLSQWGNHYVKANKDSINLRLPVAGTIARGKSEFVYPFKNTTDDYFRAGKELKNPYDSMDSKSVAQGKELYLKYCWQCHGQEGAGDGPLFASGKFPAPSWKTYKSDYIRGIQQGRMFHTITYGKNLMGSHSSQVTPTERWKIIAFIKNLAWDGFKPEVKAEASADSTATKKAVKKS